MNGAQPAPAPAPVEPARAVDLQAGKRRAPAKTGQDMLDAMRKRAAAITVEQQQKATDFMREWQQTHGQAQEKERAMER